jgi:hypothetical protein
MAASAAKIPTGKKKDATATSAQAGTTDCVRWWSRVSVDGIGIDELKPERHDHQRRERKQNPNDAEIDSARSAQRY